MPSQSTAFDLPCKSVFITFPITTEKAVVHVLIGLLSVFDWLILFLFHLKSMPFLSGYNQENSKQLQAHSPWQLEWPQAKVYWRPASSAHWSSTFTILLCLSFSAFSVFTNIFMNKEYWHCKWKGNVCYDIFQNILNILNNRVCFGPSWPFWYCIIQDKTCRLLIRIY